LTSLKKLWGLGMEPYFLRSADELLTDLVLLRRLAGLAVSPRQGGQRRDMTGIGAQTLLG
jgi:hypothetical protein